MTKDPAYFQLYKPPKQSDWQCLIAGCTYVPLAGKEPNAFHRFMQRLCFGAVWTKRPK